MQTQDKNYIFILYRFKTSNFFGNYKLLFCCEEKPAFQRPKFDYIEVQMMHALEAVEGGMSTRPASIKYNVPQTTLLDKLAGRTPKEPKMGRDPFLSEVEEHTIVAWVICCKK